MNLPSEYWLRKWSQIIRIRDGHTCVFCEEDATKVTSTVLRRNMQAHHIDEKHLEPEKALDLDNGACTCSRCHAEMAHTSDSAPKKWRAYLKRHVRYKRNADFNKKWQYKLDGGYK